MRVLPGAMLGAAIVFAAALAAADLDRLTVFEKAWDESAETEGPKAREAFQGRATDLAEHFLKSHRGTPKTGAYAFVLRALADVDSTLVLVRALLEPPVAEEGATVRKPAEIAALLGTIVDVPAIGESPRVAAALEEVASAPPEIENHDLVRAAGIALLGRCRSPEAVRALLARFADADARIRGMAIQAVGWMNERLPAAERASVLEALVKRLSGDEDLDARFHAAEAIRHLELRDGAGALDAALAREASPQVVDALVEALEALGAPITDPARCRDVAGRGFEASSMRPVFERWRAAASREDLVAAAIDGPPTLRALALRALVLDPPPPSEPTPMGEAPPPPTGPVEGLDDAQVERLLASAAELLGRDGSLSTHDTAVEAMWGLGRGNLERILPAADAVDPLPLRYLASWSLERWAGASYDSYRRGREVFAAIWLALPFLLIALGYPSGRRFAIVALLAAAGWGATAFTARGALDLPPWPYPLAKIRFLVPVAATLTAWLAIRVPKRVRLVCLLAGAGNFLTLYLATRLGGFFPPDTLDGQLFVIETLFGVAMTGPIAYLLWRLASLVPTR